MKNFKKIPELSLKYKSGKVEKFKVAVSDDAAKFMRTVFDADTIAYSEEFIVVLLDRANEVIGFSKLSSGGLDACIIEPRMIFSMALLAGARAVMLGHNHPSGNPTPSRADIQATKKLVEGGNLLDIKVLDHLIILPDGGYTSMADERII